MEQLKWQSATSNVERAMLLQIVYENTLDNLMNDIQLISFVFDKIKEHWPNLLPQDQHIVMDEIWKLYKTTPPTIEDIRGY